MLEERYLKLFTDRKNEYKTWRPIYCLALRGYIHFNSQGFNHLRFKTNNTPRNKKEAMYKLGLLPLVRAVINKATFVNKYERRFSPLGGSSKKILKEIEYWSLVEVVGKQNVKIRVILRKVGNGERINFWSVMKD